MAKYILKSCCGYLGTDNARPLDEAEFDDTDFENMEKGKLSQDAYNQLEGMAMEDQGFEWWIEKVEE